MDREDVRQSLTVIQNVTAEVANGRNYLIFPEGTRHDEIGEGKTGAAMMAIRTGAPILPVHISPQRKLFRPIEIRFGQPYMPFTEDRKANAEDYQIVTDALMEKIKALGAEGQQ